MNFERRITRSPLENAKSADRSASREPKPAEACWAARLPTVPEDSASVALRSQESPLCNMHGRRGIDYAELRRRVSIGQVLELVGFRPSGRRGGQLRGPCPVHGSRRKKSRSFSVDLERNIYQCFKASCGSKGNQLDLYVAVTGLPLYEAAIDLCDRLSIEVPWKRPG